MDIFVKENVKLRMKARKVVPSFGQLGLRCQCGSMGWRVHVLVQDNKGVTATELVCDGCERLFKISPFGVLEADGRREQVRRNGSHN